jgi:head-tail adaptor
MTKSLRRMRTYTPTQIRPYATAIGQFSLAWNDLHEAYGFLFFAAATSYHPDDVMQWMQMQAIWGCITNERQKREMLQAATERIAATNKFWREFRTDIPWVVRCGDSLEDQRNNVLHAPLHHLVHDYMVRAPNTSKGDIVPAITMLNKRALKLHEATVAQAKKLLPEIRKYHAYSQQLTGFILAMHDAWQYGPPSWPERPTLPRIRKNA